MKLKTETCLEYRLAKAWYVKYPLDACAMGPLWYTKFVGADRASDDALGLFGERPKEIWPAGPVEEVEPYGYELDCPKEILCLRSHAKM